MYRKLRRAEQSMTLFDKHTNPDALSPLTLAFVGDAYFSLVIREMLVSDANRPVRDLHKLSVKAVNAQAQAKYMKILLPVLTEKETEVFKRGRNAHTSHTPKNQSECDYHYATGFEALVGYLYLSGSLERLNSLFNVVINEIGADIFESKE